MILDTKYNPAIGSVDGRYEIDKLDATGATSAQVITFDGTSVVWGTPVVTGTLTSAHIFVGNVSNVATSVAMTGIVAINNAGVTSIPLTSAHLLIGNGSNLAASVALSGDGTVTNAGVLSVSNLHIASQAIGDVLYFNGTNWIRLPIGTAGQVLTVNGGATAPIWA